MNDAAQIVIEDVAWKKKKAFEKMLSSIDDKYHPHRSLKTSVGD